MASLSEEEKLKRNMKFEMFLSRQQANLKKKEDAIKQVKDVVNIVLLIYTVDVLFFSEYLLLTIVLLVNVYVFVYL